MRYPTELTLADVCVKAVHNSYGTGKRKITEQLEWNADRPHRGGCCGVELDVVQENGGVRWCVQHGGEYTDAKSGQLAATLAKLDQWSAQRAGDHPPVFIHFDLKNSRGHHADFPDQFDDYVRAAMPAAQFFTPGELLGGADTLLDAALDHGWPALGEAWGTFIAVLSGNQGQRTKVYLETDLAARLCFADRDIGDTVVEGTFDPRDEPNRIIYNFRYHKLGAVPRLVAPEFRRALLFRVYEVNDEATWQRARQLGVNLIATDQVFFTKWAVASAGCPVCPL
jgi:hypothetical protein